MKVTAITSKDGALLAVSYGEAAQPDPTKGPTPAESFRAGLRAGPDQQLQVIDLADDVLQIGAPSEFHHKVEAELRKKRK